MQGGQRDLGGPDEVEVVVGHTVDLLLGVGEEAGPEHRLLAHEHGRDDRLEPVRAEPLDGEAHERELEQDQRPAQVGEARARHARAGLHVDETAQQLEVIATLRAGGADLAQDLLLLPRGGRRRRQVGHDRQRGAQALVDRSHLALGAP